MRAFGKLMKCKGPVYKNEITPFKKPIRALIENTQFESDSNFRENT